MNPDLYDMIFKRKSFHLFRDRNDEVINDDEIEDIINTFNNFEPLYKDIKVKIKVVKAEVTTCKRGQEYCVEFFSERKDGYLQNIGYLGEQLDLYLVSKNIGTLWFGIAKSNEVYDGLDYVIMMAIGKVNPDKFRKDMYKSKRKELSDIWIGEELMFSNIVRFAPSACNSQPWLVRNKDDKLHIYRKSKSGKVGIMPKGASVFYNQIDIGIFMCFIELCLLKNDIKFERTLYKDNGTFENEELNAIYMLKYN